MNHDKFRQSYDFLEQYQETEIKNLEKTIKQTKTPELIDHLKSELTKYVTNALMIFIYNCNKRLIKLILTYVLF